MNIETIKEIPNKIWHFIKTHIVFDVFVGALTSFGIWYQTWYDASNRDLEEKLSRIIEINEKQQVENEMMMKVEIENPADTVSVLIEKEARRIEYALSLKKKMSRYISKFTELEERDYSYDDVLDFLNVEDENTKSILECTSSLFNNNILQIYTAINHDKYIPVRKLAEEIRVINYNWKIELYKLKNDLLYRTYQYKSKEEQNRYIKECIIELYSSDLFLKRIEKDNEYLMEYYEFLNILLRKRNLE